MYQPQARQKRTASRRLADIHPCQAVHVKMQHTPTQPDASPGGSGFTAKRFLGKI